MDVFNVTVRNQDKAFVTGNQDYEQYALFYSKEMAKLFHDDDSEEDLNIGRFVKIVSCDNRRRRVYRKCSARNGIHSGEVAIGFRTQNELGCPQKVDVYKTTWFQYYWHNSDTYIQFIFAITVLGAICSIASFIMMLVNI